MHFPCSLCVGKTSLQLHKANKVKHFTLCNVLYSVFNNMNSGQIEIYKWVDFIAIYKMTSKMINKL